MRSSGGAARSSRAAEVDAKRGVADSAGMSTNLLSLFSLAPMALFVALFAVGTRPEIFWWWMAGNGVLLSRLGLWLDRGLRRELSADLRRLALGTVALGASSSSLLYGIFALGNWGLRRLTAAAGAGIQDVYRFGEGVPTWRIVALLCLAIGPAEEIVWRGVLQRGWSARLGDRRGWMAATATYAAVHLASGNPVLAMAALVGGAVWGWMYLRCRSLTANIISHTLWDLAVFVWFPFQ